MGLRVALFVEGSETPPQRGKRPLQQIWNEDLPQALGVDSFASIIPISKKHLVAMDPDMPPMSGAGESLDQLMVRMLKREPFDAAIVAWDLVPAWNPEVAGLCRWAETLRFYELLGADGCCLDEAWKTKASNRFDELSSRPIARARRGPPVLENFSILALCMEPMFEACLILDEGAIRRALGVAHTKRPRNWPSDGWGGGQNQRPDQLLAAVINALDRERPKPKILRQVGGNMRNNKDGWGEYLLRTMLADEEVSEVILEHPIAARLAELLR